jgi:hypothetical protein
MVVYLLYREYSFVRADSGESVGRSLRQVGPTRNEKVSFMAELSRTVFLNRRARGPVPGPGINYTGPREVLLEFLVF